MPFGKRHTGHLGREAEFSSEIVGLVRHCRSPATTWHASDWPTSVGFAVGTEPLASAFAAKGASILGTDCGSDEAGWTATNEHAASLEALYYPAAIDRETFLANVRFQPADMRNVSTLAGSNFDFSLELLFFRAAWMPVFALSLTE